MTKRLEGRLTDLNSDERPDALLVLPGGGYAVHAPHEAEPVAEWGRSLGLAGYVLRYQLGHHPTPLNDVAAAMDLLRAKHRWIAILGFSAGGHLAATALTLLKGSQRPNAGILIYPVVSLRESYAHGGSRTNLLGENPPPVLVEGLSAERQVSSGTPPTFLFHGADDDGVPVENALSFASAMARVGVPFELHVPHHGPHGFGMGEPGSPQDWTGLAARWLGSVRP